jgi:hypothetical protein
VWNAIIIHSKNLKLIVEILFLCIRVKLRAKTEKYECSCSSKGSSVLLAARADGVWHLRGRRRLRSVRTRFSRQPPQRRRCFVGRQRCGGLGGHPGDGHGRLLAGQDLIERRERVPKIPIAAISVCCVCCENGENSHAIGENELFERESDPSKDLEQLETNYKWYFNCISEIFLITVVQTSVLWISPVTYFILFNMIWVRHFYDLRRVWII